MRSLEKVRFLELECIDFAMSDASHKGGMMAGREGVWDCCTERGEVGVKSGKEHEGGDTQYRQPMCDAA